MSDVLLDEETEEVKIVKASRGKRFLNYIIDYVVILVVGIVVLIGLELMEIVSLEGVEESRIYDVAFILFYIGYYFLSETFLKGKTVAKYITRTRVVTEDGGYPDFVSVIKRSFSRIVPFENFSFLGGDAEGPRGWHDKWSDTYVVDERSSVL